MAYLLFTLVPVVLKCIDFFYPVFRRFMPPQTYRYAVCGGANVVFGFLVFTAVFHLLGAQTVTLGTWVFEAYSLALVISSIGVFTLGFLLNKYIVFTSSPLSGRIQLFRYLLTFSINLVLDYLLLKLAVRTMGIYPVLAQVLVTALVIVLSFFVQHYFTFRVRHQKLSQHRNASLGS